MNYIEKNKEQNLISDFKKCGIFPLNKQMLIDRLLQNLLEVNNTIVGSAFLEQLDS